MEGRDEKRDVLAFKAGVLLSPTCLASTATNNRLFPRLGRHVKCKKHMQTCVPATGVLRCSAARTSNSSICVITSALRSGEGASTVKAGPAASLASTWPPSPPFAFT